jgi:hypothetical protein
MSDRERRLDDLRKGQKHAREQKSMDDALKRLQAISKSKFQTCFIFALAEFETVFGLELWGHGLRDEDLTPMQRANRGRWEKVRTDILNKGNAQLRAMETELGLHEIRFVGYQMDLGGRQDERD